MQGPDEVVPLEPGYDYPKFIHGIRTLPALPLDELGNLVGCEVKCIDPKRFVADKSVKPTRRPAHLLYERVCAAMAGVPAWDALTEDAQKQSIDKLKSRWYSATKITAILKVRLGK